ncbi:hypothetical protein KFK09_005014 [Dendrobium nobile]|uniref:Uncharacterized protein n=1 Tax=Dendrobium nobile TaxID=94219 RepID=A0A8T3BZL8_DENNO|nr:hypothetical protein KFK09_005014 [Dendrobium nobile]
MITSELSSARSSIGYAVYTKFGMRNWWYLQPENASTLYNPLMPALSGIFHLVTALIIGCEGLAVCHTTIPEHDEENGTFTYEAESPDEGAFLVAAREFGFEFFKRTQSKYSTWNAEFLRAKTAIGPDRDAQLKQVADMMEGELVFIGATAVEDKLQKGVPQCIDKLAQAGLKIWLLTGDKMETAVNIGFACSLLRLGLKQISISTMNTDFLDQDAKKAFLSCLVSEQTIKDNILLQITNASRTVKLEKDPHAAFALIIDGKALSYALEDDMKHHFLGLAW